MANLIVKDGNGVIRELKTRSGDGSALSPFVVEHAFALPTDAATESAQDAQTVSLDDLRVRIGGLDDAQATLTGDGSLNAIQKRVRTLLNDIKALLGGTLSVSAATLPLPANAATESTANAMASTATNSDSTLTAINTKLGSIDVDIGATTDTPALDDGGTWSLIALVKRVLQGISTALSNWTTLLTRVPALESGRMPVVLPPGGGGLTNNELRAAPLPVSGGLIDEQSVAMLHALLGNLPLVVDFVGGGTPYSAVANTPTIRIAWANTAVINAVNGVSSVANIVNAGGVPLNYDQYYAGLAAHNDLMRNI
jgi:hypothetical protein